MRILRLAFAFALAVAPTLATAQQFPTVPSDTVIGRTQIGSGPAQAIPFSQLIALMLQQSSLNIPTVNTNSIIFKGSSSGQATLQAQAVAGTPTLNLPNLSGTIPSTATSPIVLDPASGNISCPTCATSVSTSNPVVASRATAETLNLSGLSALTTLGYATPGDGGGATFQQVSSTTPFIDSFISAGSITAAGSSYVNGTYFGVSLTGGTGVGAVATITVSGGAVTAVSIVNSPGNGYKVGDVLSVPAGVLGVGGSGFQYTISAVTTPLASFTDAVGTRFQYVVDAGSFPNTRQFGAKIDGDGTGLGTDDTAAIQAALWYTGRRDAQNADSGGFEGGTLIQPVGVSNICTQTGLALVVPFGVKYSGSWGGSTLRVCDNVASGASIIFLGDPQTHLASLRSTLANMTVFGKRGISAATSAAMIASNNTQDGGGLDHVYIYAGQRECMDFETGYGGASTVYMNDVSCSLEGSNTGAVFNYGTTMVNMKNMVFGAPSSGTNNTSLTMELFGGMYHIEGFHTEEIPFGIAVNMSGTINENMVTVQNATGGTGCTGLITLLAANTPGNFAIQQASNNGCTDLVVNGQPGGTTRAGPATPKDGWVSFNP